ncbi:MAG: PIN domain-containing protein [Ignisphaera sp.]
MSIKDCIITESILQEFAEFIYEKYVEFMNSSQRDRALGYIRLFKYIVELLSKCPLVIHSFYDYLKAMDLAISRNLDITDALLVITAKKINGIILTRDREFERVKDFVKIIYD